MLSNDLRRRFQFFLQHAGYIVGQRAVCALALARAEQWYDDHVDDYGLTKIEEPDPDTDLGDHELWCPTARRESSREGSTWQARGYSCSHEGYYLAIVNAAGDHLAGLGGVLDPSPAYTRVVYAELMSEVRDRLETATPLVTLSEN